MQKLDVLRTQSVPGSMPLSVEALPTVYVDTAAEIVSKLDQRRNVQLTYRDGVVVCRLQSDGRVEVDGMRTFSRLFESPTELLGWLGAGEGDDVLTTQQFSLD